MFQKIIPTFLRNRLSRKVLMIAFAVVVMVEGALISIIIDRYEKNQLQSLNDQAKLLVSSVFLTHSDDISIDKLTAALNKILSEGVISGGLLLTGVGDLSVHSGAPLASITNKEKMDVLWQAEQVNAPYPIHARLNTAAVQLRVSDFTRQTIAMAVTVSFAIVLGLALIMNMLVMTPYLALRNYVGLPREIDTSKTQWQDIDQILSKRFKPQAEIISVVDDNAVILIAEKEAEIARLKNIETELSLQISDIQKPAQLSTTDIPAKTLDNLLEHAIHQWNIERDLEEQSEPYTGAVYVLELISNSDEDISHAFRMDTLHRLNDSVGDTGKVIRLSPSSFAIIIDKKQSVTDHFNNAERFNSSMAGTFRDNAIAFQLSAKTGIARYPADARTTAKLIRNATLALDHAKSDAGNSARFFAAKTNEALKDHVSISTDIRNAVSSGDISFVYQARLNLNSYEITGVEALIRWNHRGKTLLPADFIAIAESSDAGAAIGRRALFECTNAHKVLLDDGMRSMVLSINVSPSLMKSGEILNAVRAALFESQLPSHLLELEFPEGLLMSDPVGYKPTIMALHHMGVKIALDSFGTGYSSIKHLADLPIDRLKIDQSFVSECDPMGTKTSSDIKTIQAAATLSIGLDIAVTAVGTQTLDQVDFVQSMGIEEIQGHAFVEPMEINNFKEFVANFSETTKTVQAQSLEYQKQSA